MKRQILAVSILLVATQLFGQESRFWVGGSGKWADNSHWATVSGGEPGATVPESGTSVVFDANSFSGAKNTVTLSDEVVIGSLTASDAEFVFSGKKSLTVGGSVSVDSKVDFGKLRGALVLSAEGNQTLNLPATLEGDIVINGGNWTLESDLATEKDIIINGGTFATNNYRISCKNFITNTSNVVNVDLGTSAVEVGNKWEAVLENSNSVFDASKADITMLNGFNKKVRTIGNVKYSSLHRDNPSKSVTLGKKDEKRVSCNVNGLYVEDGNPSKSELVNDGGITITVSGATSTYDLNFYGHNDQGQLVLDSKKSKTGISASQKEVPFDKLSAGNYTIDFVSADGTTSLSFDIYAPEELKPTISVKDPAKCYLGEIKQLEAKATGGNDGGYTWTWERDFVYDDEYYSDGEYAYNFGYGQAVTVFAEDTKGCISKKTFNYYDEGEDGNDYHNQPQQIVVSGVSTNTCAGESTGTITVTIVNPGTAPYTYYTTKSGIEYKDADENVIKNLPQGLHSVVVEDVNSCLAKALTVDVKSNNAPTATLSGDTENCIGDEDGFALTGVAKNSSGVEWIKIGAGNWGTESTSGDNKQRTSTNVYHPSLTEETAGTTKVVFKANPLDGCKAKTDTIELKIISIPEPVITTTNDTTICGHSFEIKTSSPKGTFEWIEKSGNPSKAKFVGNTVTVEKDGSYYFTLKDQSGECYNETDDEFKISFYASPDVEINDDVTTVCNNDTLPLSAKIDNVKSFVWSCPASVGTIPESDKQSKTSKFIPNSGYSGTATITLSYTANGNCDSGSKTIEITVNPAPTPIFVTTPDNLCGDKKDVTVTIASGNKVEWFKGATGDKSKYNIENSKSATATITTTATGTYGVYAVETATNGCSAKTNGELAISFTMLPTVTISSVSDEEICGDGVSAITASSDLTINWSTNGESGTCSPAKGKTTVYTPADNDQGKDIKIYATVSGTGVCAGKTAKDSTTVKVNKVPAPSLSAKAAVCGDSVRVKLSNAIKNSTKNYSKHSGPGEATFLNKTDTSVDIKVTKPGSYEFYLTEVNGDCSNETPASVKIRFDEKLSLTLESLEDDTYMCSTGNDGEYKLKATAPGCDEKYISWSISDGEGSFDPTFGKNVTFSPKLKANEDSHEYKIMATGTPIASVCPAPYDSIKIMVYRKPTPTFAGGTVCGLSDEFTATKSIATSKGFWSPMDNNPNIKIDVNEHDDTQAVITDISGEGGTYSIVFTEKNGECSKSDTAEVTFLLNPVAYAGNDTTICYDAELKISALADTSHCDELLWLTSGTGNFADNVTDIIRPTYIPSEADKAAEQVTLSLIAKSNTCSKADTSKIVVTINPEFTVGIGSVSPFDISASTTIEVQLWLEHQNFAYLSYHLVAPDGTMVKLYDHYHDIASGGSKLRNTTMEGLKFTTKSSDELNLKNIDTPFTGEFKVTDANGWANIYGKDPAEGGWSVIVKSEYGDVVGTLKRATIAFTDLNREGVPQTVMFDSKEINTFIVANPGRVKYMVPMGLYTRCFNTQDAHAIVNPIGGSGVYDLFEWNDPSITGNDVLLGAGDWTVTVTDNVGCKAKGSVTVNSPDTIKIETNKNDNVCFGAKAGSATVSLKSGGVGDISFNWTSDSSNGETISTANTISDVAKDIYYVYAIDQNECRSKVDTVEITAPDSIKAELAITPATSCEEGVYNGSVTYTLSKGNGAPYKVELYKSDIALPKMEILPNAENDIIKVTGLGASDSLIFRIFDKEGCYIDDTISTEPENSITIDNVYADHNVCATKSEGSITVTNILYGSGKYKYEWFNEGVKIAETESNEYTGLAASKEYSVKVTDLSTNCSDTYEHIEVQDPDTIKFATPVFTDSIKCFGEETASFSVAVTGGTGALSYEWVGVEGAYGNSLADVPAGNYKLIVTDKNYCQDSTIVVVASPDSKLTMTAGQDEEGLADCGVENGKVTASAAGGSEDNYFEYTWISMEDGAAKDGTVAHREDLGAGQYRVVAKDKFGCEIADTIEVKDNGQVAFTDSLVRGVSCLTREDAIVKITSVTDKNGAVSNYTVKWSDNDSIKAPEKMMYNLGAKTYVTVITEDKCHSSRLIEAVNDSTLHVVKVTNYPDLNGAPNGNGSLSVQVAGGVGGYKFEWTNSNNNIENNGAITTWYELLEGEYKLHIEDGVNDGCVIDTSFTIIHDPLRDTLIKNVPVTCQGGSDGELLVKGKGGYSDESYEFLWTKINENGTADSVGNTANIKNLKAGLYVCVVLQRNGRIMQKVPDTIKVEEPTFKLHFPTDSIITDSTYCNKNGGSITIKVPANGDVAFSEYGGYLPFSYAFKQGNDTIGEEISINSLKVGSYTVRVKDNLGCWAEQSVTVGDLSKFEVKHVEPDTLRCYGSKGKLAVSAKSNNGDNFKYQWKMWKNDDDEILENSTLEDTTANVEGLAAGTYMVKVTDDSSCVKYDTIRLTQRRPIMFSVSNTMPNSCFTRADGEIRIDSLRGGSRKFVYFEFKGTSNYGDSVRVDTAYTLKGKLLAGNYTVLVEDNLGCQSEKVSFTVNSLPRIDFKVSNTVANSCYNTNDGEVKIENLQGGTEKYSRFVVTDVNGIDTLYSSEMLVASKPGTIRTDTTFLPELYEGKYLALVADTSGCFSEPDTLKMYKMRSKIEISKINDDVLPNCLTNNQNGSISAEGKITISHVLPDFAQVSGTDTDLKLFYSIDEGKFSDKSTFSNLTAGEHKIVISYMAADTALCPVDTVYTLGSKSQLQAKAAFRISGGDAKSIFACPDQELTARVDAVGAKGKFDYMFYTLFDEDAEKLVPYEPAPEPAKQVVPEPTPSDTTNVTDSASAVAYMFHRGLYYRADSLPADSTAVTDSAPAADTIVLPVYDHTTIRGRQVAMLAQGSKADKQAYVDNFKPYGVETFYYFEVNDGVCLNVDSIKATALRPTEDLQIVVDMEDATSDELLVGREYEVPEGGILTFTANQLEFEFSDNIFAFAENGWLWQSAPLDGSSSSGVDIRDTESESFNVNPLIAKAYGRFAAKVWDSVRFELSDDTPGVYYISDTTVTCSFYDTVVVNSISGIRPMQVFTPNGDEYNEYWEIDGLASYDNATIYVFNRWGGRVWQYSGSGKDYEAHKWNGRNEKNKPVPSGTYYYVIQCGDKYLPGRKVTGPVTVIR